MLFTHLSYHKFQIDKWRRSTSAEISAWYHNIIKPDRKRCMDTIQLYPLSKVLIH